MYSASFRCTLLEPLEPTKRVAASVDVCVCRHIGSMCRGPLGIIGWRPSCACGADDSSIADWPGVSDARKVHSAVP